jgi:hypothetical protein
MQYQVINCGTSSYSPLLHFLRYKHQLHRVRPDEVIVNIDLTDIYDDNVRYRDEAVFSEDGEPLSAGPARFSAQELMDGMRFRFYTARLFFGRPRGHELLPTEENVFAYHNDLPADSARWQQHVGFTIDLIRRLVETIRTSGARVTLTMYPYREQIRPLGGGPVWNRAFEARVAELAADLNVPFYSAYDDIRLLLMEGRKLYWTNDPHFNPDGQRAWSEAFARYYVTRMGTE